MGEQTPSKMIQRGEFLRASINYSGLKLDISSRNASQSLADIRRILECLSSQNEEVEDFTSFEMSTLLSEEFIANTQAMAEIRRLLGMEQQYRVVKDLVSAIEEIDLNEGKKQLRLESFIMKRSVAALLSTVDTRVVRHALIHVKGLISEQERLMIIDRIHERIPQAQLRAYQTEQDIEGKILVEALLFGDFEEEVM